jgi:hypothetical protein
MLGAVLAYGICGGLAQRHATLLAGADSRPSSAPCCCSIAADIIPD